MFRQKLPGALAPFAEKAARAGSKTSTASAAIAPPLVAPKDRMSTPARQLISAAEALSRTSALAKRAPSMCKASERSCAISARPAISSVR
jgi:hypothetical protein